MKKHMVNKVVKLVSKVFVTLVVVISIMITNSDKLLISAAQLLHSKVRTNEVINKKYNFSDYKGVYELEEYRDIDKKVFVNEDNKLEMAIYGDAVHYLKDNHYIDIDNTLVYDKENKHYTNVNNFYKVVFPDDISDNQIQINYYDYSIRQRIMDVQSSNLHPIDKIKEKKDDIKELSKVTSGVIYKNINKHIDIQYSLKGQSIKEEIVLHRYKPNFSMIFEFELENLVIENYYGIYYFINNDGEKVSNFSNLIMIDNNGVLSDKVYLDVKKTADNIYQVTISADNEFLLNANYPVTIDPSIDLSYTGLTIQAKQIYRDYGSSYYALVDNPQYLNVSRGNYGRIVNETYIGFSGIQTALSNIKKIDNVILELNVNTTSGFASKPIAAYEILNYSYSQIGTSPISLQTNSIDIVDYSYGDGIINFDFTNTIKYWLENYINSRAIRILSPQSYSDYSFNIYGTSNPKMNLRPALRVYYGSITGMVPYQDYSSYETSTGNLFINNSSLMPTYVSNDYISDSLQISHIYNNIRLSDINYGFGINWNLNINKEFCFSTSSYMINADGYETWYSPINEIATDGSESTYSYHQYWPTDDYYGVDNDSSDTSINLVPENQSVIFVKTKDNIQYEFRKFAGYLYYKLVKIINLDINGNRQNNEYLTITYIKDNGLWIDSINLYSYNENTNQFNKTQTAQLYYTNNKLYQLIIKKINDNGLLSPFQSLEYNYDSNNPDLLSNINISYDYEQDGFSEDDKKDVINFSYSNNLNLLSIDRVNFDRLEIIYSKTKTVQKVIKKNGSLLIDQFTFLRHENATVIIDKNGNKTTKRFDELDRFVGSTNHLGIANNISYYDHGTDNINYHNIHKVIGTSSYVEPYTNLIINGEFEYDETNYNDSPYYWGLENNNINIGSASIYTCTSDIDLCKNRVNSGKKSLQISKYTPLVDYMLYQYVYVREGYYSLSAYVSGSLTIEIDEGLDIVVYSAFGPVDNSENPNMVFKRLVFYSNGSSLTRVKIRFEDNQIGDAFIDDIKLTPVVGTELTNLVVNSSFEDNFTNYTGNVEKATIVSDEYTLDQKKIYGAKLVKMEANLNSKSIKQNIYIPSIKGTKTFTFGGTIRTDFKSITEANASIKLVGYYVGGHQKSFTLNANNLIKNEWQQLSASTRFDDIKSGGVTYALEYLEIIIEVSDLDLSYVYFDNLFVYKKTTNNIYHYGEDGNLSGKLIYMIDSNNITYDLTYDQHGNLKSFKSGLNPYYITVNKYNDNRELVCSFVQFIRKDENGNYIYNECDSPNNIKNIKVTKTGLQAITETSIDNGKIKYSHTITDNYSTYKNYITSTTNEFGKTTEYDYNEVTGLIEKIKSPNNAEVFYDYDDLGRIRSISESKGLNGVNIITYIYDDYNNIDKIIVNEGESNEVIYDLDFDQIGRLIQVKIGSNSILTNTYYKDGVFETNLPSSTIYQNGTFYNFEYNNNDRLKLVKVNGVDRFKYEYDQIGNIIKYEEIINGNTDVYQYLYDGNGRLSTIRKNGNNISAYKYDIYGNILQEISSFNTLTFYMDYEKERLLDIQYKIQEGINSYSFNKHYEYAESGLNRLQYFDIKSNDKIILSKLYLFDGEDEEILSNRIKSEHNYTFNPNRSVNTSFRYTYEYNDLGYIKTITDVNSRSSIEYTYDSKGQVEYEIYKDNNKNIIMQYQYKYDGYGNIKERLKNSVVDKSYSYDNNWPNRLSSFNGNTILYDEIGNPISYNGYTYQYEGRQLVSISKDNTSVSYFYNGEGIRVKKNVNGVITDYSLMGNRILNETRRANGITINQLFYTYDESGRVVSVTHYDKNRETYNTYFYIHNLLGDVISLVRKDGSIEQTYSYDAYGNLMNEITSTIGAINPFRYRGYYYDSETGLYWLSSRYYDPEIGRFISPDDVDYLSPESINGLNLYAYCGNDPVNKVDPTGHFGILTTMLITGLIMGGAMVGFQGVSDLAIAAQNGNWDHVKWQDYVGAFAGGFVGGALSVVCVSGLAASLAATGVSRLVSMELQNATGDANYSTWDIVKDVGLSMLITAGTYGLTYGIGGKLSGNNPFKTYSDLPYLLGHGLTDGVQKQVVRTFMYQYTIMTINMGLISSFNDYLGSYKWKEKLLGAF